MRSGGDVPRVFEKVAANRFAFPRTNFQRFPRLYRLVNVPETGFGRLGHIWRKSSKILGPAGRFAKWVRGYEARLRERTLPRLWAFYKVFPPSNLTIHSVTAVSSNSSGTPRISMGPESVVGSSLGFRAVCANSSCILHAIRIPSVERR